MKTESEVATGASPAVGIVLTVAALLEIAVMIHHPTVKAPDLAQSIVRLREVGPVSAWVHGLLIALMLAVLYGLSEFALWRGIRRPGIRVGLIAYAFGVGAMIMATAVSGFMTAAVTAGTRAATAAVIKPLTAVAMIMAPTPKA